MIRKHALTVPIAAEPSADGGFMCGACGFSTSSAEEVLEHDCPKRTREQIEEQLRVLPEWLRHAIVLQETFPGLPSFNAEFAVIAKRCNWLYEVITGLYVGDNGVLAAIEKARNLAMAVNAGPEEDEG